MFKKYLVMDEGELMSREAYEKRRLERTTQITEDVTSERECFLQNAFLFYSATERILADETLSFIPVPFDNNLAYIGTSQLRNATLGVYVKWWQIYQDALIFAKKPGLFSKKIEPRLLFFLAGSPLSGNNSCSAVNPKGETYQHIVPSPFYNAWRPFAEINTSYSNDEKEAKRGNLTLRDAARILREDSSVITQYKVFLHDITERCDITE